MDTLRGCVIYLQDIVATPERPLLTDLPSPDYSYNGAISNNIYHEIPDLQPIHRPIQLAAAANTAGIQLPSCNTSSSSSGYGSVLRYDNVRGDSRGPFISYPVLEDRPFQPSLSRPNNLALEKQAHDSPLI